MIKSDIQFQINQLRKDKIIYAIEAVAINSAMALLMVAGMFSPYGPFIVYGGSFIGLGYTIYMGIGNFQRLQKIKKLEHNVSKM